MTPPDIEKLPVYLRPALRLFMSADLVGSTAFKQKPSYPLAGEDDDTKPPGPHWLESITDFYSDFRTESGSQWKMLCERSKDFGWEPKYSPLFWKGVGDEIIYVLDLHDPRDVDAAIHAWVWTMQKYRAMLKSKQPSLDIKSTAWIAGFPINNSEVVFDLELDTNSVQTDDPRLSHFQKLGDFHANNNDRGRYVRDFIGTSIDTGFRLAIKSMPRRMVVAIEVILFLTKARLDVGRDDLGFMDIYFDGYYTLKGVIGGRPYPIFWVDMFKSYGKDSGNNDTLSKAQALADDEDKLLNRAAGNGDLLGSFCRHFIDAHSEHLVCPFIYDCSDPNFNVAPAGYTDKLFEWHSKIQKEGAKAKSEMEMPLEPPQGGAESDEKNSPTNPQLTAWLVRFERKGAKKNKKRTSKNVTTPKKLPRKPRKR